MRSGFYRDYFELEDRHWWFVGRREIFLRLLDRYLPPVNDGGPRAILDVGCGTGTMLRHLERYGSPQGVEADEEAVRLCRERGEERVRLTNPPPLPFESEQFDLVTALDVLEHVEEDRRLVGEIHRVLRPGGAVLVSVPAFRFLWGIQDEVSQHRRRYVSREVRSLLTDAGFDIRRLSYFNSLLFGPIAAVRLLRRLRPVPPRVTSDFELTRPGRLNSLLALAFASESRLIARRGLPFGVSILALAFKPS